MVLGSASMVHWLVNNVDIPTALLVTTDDTHVNMVALLVLYIRLQLHKSLNGNPYLTTQNIYIFSSKFYIRTDQELVFD